MTEGPDWHLYQTFLGVMRHGSLSAAARRLRLTQPTVGRHVEELERVLGAALFTRSQSGLIPTPLAHGLLAKAEEMEIAAAAFVRAAEGAARADAVAGTVRITASEVFGAEVLPAMLADLRADHPRIVFELDLTKRKQDLLRREADIAVRSSRPQQAAIVAKRLGRFAIGLYARRDYAERRGLPRTVAEIRAFDLIGFDRDDGAVRAVAPGSAWIDRTLFNLRVDNDLAQLAALRAGLGIGVMFKLVAARSPDLVPVLEKEVRFEIETWIAMHEDQRANPPVRTVYDALSRKIADWMAPRAGRAR